MPDAQPLALLTPSWIGDLPRLLFLRESLAHFACTIPHLVVVHTEDATAMRQALGRDHLLEVITTADVLPAPVERWRRLGQGSRASLRYRLGKWLSADRRLPGWYAQQYVKLAAARLADFRAFVCVDSDLYLRHPIGAADFTDEQGRLHHVSTPHCRDAESASWNVLALRLFGAKLAQQPLPEYVHQPLPMHCAVTQAMLAALEQRHGRPWFRTLASQRAFSEYALYGVWLQLNPDPQRVVQRSPLPIHEARFPGALDQGLAHWLATGVPEQRFGLMQSNLDVDPQRYRDAVRAGWPG